MLGAWIATDAAKNKALQYIVLIPLVLTYFVDYFEFCDYCSFKHAISWLMYLYDFVELYLCSSGSGFLGSLFNHFRDLD